MPRTVRWSTPVLGIRLETQQTVFSPGDTIVGVVHRKDPVVSPNGRVMVSLHGRAKTLVDEQSGSKTTYRGRTRLINDHESTQTIYQGPIHIPEGGDGLEWRFALTIPTHVWRGDVVSQDRTPEAIVEERLPPTYTGGNTTKEAFIEYFIRAELCITAKGRSDQYQASMPFDLRLYRPDPPIIDGKLKRALIPRSVVSQRLFSGMENAELSRSQKWKKFFGTPSVPVFWFNLETVIPSIIELESPSPISFRIRIVPIWERTSQVIENVPHKAQLIGMSISIREITAIKSEGMFQTHDDCFYSKIDFRLDKAIERQGKVIEIPCADKQPPVDVGAELGFRIGHQYYYGGGQRFPYHYGGHRFPHYTHRVVPDFATYYIKVTNHLEWSARVKIAGEECLFHGVRPVTVLPASAMRPGTEPWIQPPDEGDAPPSFSEVQKEHMMSDVAIEGSKLEEDEKLSSASKE